MAALRSPVWIPPAAPSLFPDPRGFDAQGLVAGGGDLSSARLLAAYRAGIFPWYDEPPILWWSPDPRAIIDPQHLHVSRSLARRMKRGTLRVTRNRDPVAVLQGCADRSGGTWLNREMALAYLRLFELGHLVSYEVYDVESSANESDQTLVGGLYGVLVDGLFAAESKFHRKTDASKMALVCAVSDLFEQGVELFDVQFLTDHLRSLGVYEVPRSFYLGELARVRQASVCITPSSSNLVPEVMSRLQGRTEHR